MREPSVTAASSHSGDQLYGVQGHGVVERLVVVAGEAFDGVRKGVHAGRGRDRRRQADHQFRVDERHVRGDQRRAADVEFDVAARVGDDRPQGDLTAGARGCRYSDERRMRFSMGSRPHS